MRLFSSSYLSTLSFLDSESNRASSFFSVSLLSFTLVIYLSVVADQTACLTVFLRRLAIVGFLYWFCVAGRFRLFGAEPPWPSCWGWSLWGFFSAHETDHSAGATPFELGRYGFKHLQVPFILNDSHLRGFFCPSCWELPGSVPVLRLKPSLNSGHHRPHRSVTLLNLTNCYYAPSLYQLLRLRIRPKGGCNGSALSFTLAIA